MTLTKIFQLKVIKIGRGCNFELSWDEGQTISAQQDYPDSLTNSYIDWQKAYLKCYQNLRGKVIKSGSFKAPPKDTEGMLREAEAHFLSEFHRWLRSEQLYEIREKIADVARNAPISDHFWVDVLLSCNCPELARLPWEAWEINTKLSAPRTKPIRLARIPSHIRYSTISPVRRKARVLAILGDEKGLDFKEDKQALDNLSKVTEVEFAGWQPGKDIAELKKEIAEKIADARGWDILFFAGHSNETALTGGELSIASNVSMAMSEIEQPLQQARDRGLQFAIFNSCSGIAIAESLINLGLPQVAVMREPIHNRVAQEFLVQFLNSLAEYKDVHEALIDACKLLHDKHLTYPSAYLIPSLFRHPRAELFRLEPSSFQQIIKHLLPNKLEALAISTILTFSLLYPVQDRLLDVRIWVQTIYRQVTHQYPFQERTPVLLVEIDEDSRRADPDALKNIRPINYRYLARLLNKLSDLEAKVVGIDYVLDDKAQPAYSRELGMSIRHGVKQGTWFIFAANESTISNYGVSNEIASLNWSMQGHFISYDWNVELLPAKADCFESCPFTYLLALTYALNKVDVHGLPKPQLGNKTDLREQLIQYLNQENIKEDKVAYLHKLHLHPISSFLSGFLNWFHPIIDFSLPPNQVYESIFAYQLLEGKVPSNIEQQVVLIVPGGYREAGVDEEGEDNIRTPLAIGLWGEWSKRFTGGKLNAYMVHHLLTQRLVVPIPDFLMVLLATLVGKGVTLILQNNRRGQQRWVIGLGTSMVVYFVIALQMYISSAVLLPLLFPLAVFGNYVRLALKSSRR